jgi:hypothetical protein
MTIAVSCPPIWGIPSTRLAGRLNLLLSQLPGRFCAPFSIEPSLLMTPGQAMPMNGASLNPSLSAFAIRLEELDETLYRLLAARLIIRMTP